ncbi:kinesin-related protein 4-like [Leptopilina heterotoma]|uniref:kinesin-related protein 4-like n=1 Tax=Leptopilina heterotoma TaxID=63436 RepID=UPI001CA82D58|nr:kinesin-related protein 4-like [Leptopilina heterotoma]
MKNEDFENCISSRNNQVLSPKMNFQSPQKLFIKCRNIDESEKEIITEINELETGRMNSKENDFFTPPKLSNDLFDSTIPNEDEVAKLLYDSENILNLDSIQVTNDSILNFSSLDENSNNENSSEKSPVDPLSLDNVNTVEMKNVLPNKSESRKNLNYDSDDESEDEEESEDEGEDDDDEDEEDSEEDDDDEDEDDEENEEIAEKLFKTQKNNSKKEILSTETIEKLNKLVIRLTHVVPPQHKVESTSGSRTLTRKEWKAFDKFSKRIRTKFTEKEDSIIRQNWKLFCKIHDWDENDVQSFLYLKHQGKIYIKSSLERKKFVQFLAKGLPYRTLFSVYTRFRFLFRNHAYHGRFTPEEDKKIMIFMNSSNVVRQCKISELSKILKRTHISIFKRYQKLLKAKTNRKRRNKQSQDKVVWTLELTEKFLVNLIKLTLSKNVNELENQKIPQVVWKEMKKRMGIEVNVLKYFWFGRLHLQLFSPDPIYLNDIKIKLIEFLYSLELKSTKEIKWAEVLNNFEGMTIFFLSDLTHRLLKHIKNKTTNFTESMNHLYEKIIPQLENNLKDKYLPRLCYKNKKLTVVDDIEEIESKNLSSNEDDSKLSKGQEKKEKKLRTLKKSDSTENKNLSSNEDDSKLPKEQDKKEKKLRTLKKSDSIENKNRASKENVNKLTKEVRNKERKLGNLKKESSEKENLDWSLSLREKFLKKLLELMISDDIGELKDALIHTVVWKEMTKYFPVHHSELENLWYNELHLQLYSPRPIYLNDVKIKLIELIYRKQFESEQEINWEIVCCSFDGFTKNFLSQVFNNLVDVAMKEKNFSKFADITKYLYETTLMEIKTGENDQFLPRIIFENGKIQFVDINLENDENYCKSENEIDDKWELLMTSKFREKFLKSLLRLNLSMKIEELKDAEIPDVVWMEMEKELKTDMKILMNLWYKEMHLQLFSPRPIYLNDIKICLIELIYNCRITDEKQINWDEISSHFDGMTEIFLSEIFVDLLNFASKEINSSKFTEIIKYLYETMFLKLKEGEFDKCLPRICFENDEIQVIDEKIENDVTCKREENVESEIANEMENFWTVPMREIFLECLLCVNLSETIEELKDAFIPGVVWKEMEKQLEIDRNILENLWYKELHLQLFSPRPIYLNDIKMYLIELIYKSEVTDFDDIDWNEISSHFDGMTTVFLSQVFQELVESTSKIINSKKFCDIIDYMNEITFNEIKNSSSDQMLPQIIFNNGKISTVESEKKS